MIVLLTLMAGVLATTLYMVLGLDDWLGILAFKYHYLAFSAIVASIMGTAWLGTSRKMALGMAAGIFTLLLTPYFVSRPSSRILRSVMLDTPVGTHRLEVEAKVRNAYMRSDYRVPRIKRTNQRLYISLSNQSPGDCTAAIYHLADGRVIAAEFSAD